MRMVKNKNMDILIVAIGFGLSYWFLDSLLCYIYSDSVSFAVELFQPSTEKAYNRIIVICFLVLFNCHSMTKYEKLEKDMDELTTMVNTLQNDSRQQQGNSDHGEAKDDSETLTL